jgi:hypothetical protein
MIKLIGSVTIGASTLSHYQFFQFLIASSAAILGVTFHAMAFLSTSSFIDLDILIRLDFFHFWGRLVPFY